MQIVHKTVSQKYPSQKGAGRVDQGVELLCSKHEALHSNKKEIRNNEDNAEYERGIQ
jgi:hypothetical protein